MVPGNISSENISQGKIPPDKFSRIKFPQEIFPGKIFSENIFPGNFPRKFPGNIFGARSAPEIFWGICFKIPKKNGAAGPENFGVPWCISAVEIPEKSNPPPHQRARGGGSGVQPLEIQVGGGGQPVGPHSWMPYDEPYFLVSWPTFLVG